MNTSPYKCRWCNYECVKEVSAEEERRFYLKSSVIIAMGVHGLFGTWKELKIFERKCQKDEK